MYKELKTWKDWDAQHICDQIEKLYQEFGLEIDWSDFAGVSTFGDICDTICVSVAWRYRDGGRLQQSFYKLRKAIAEVTGVNPGEISPETRLEELFLPKDRRRRIKELEMVLGFRMHLLGARRWFTVTMAAVMVVSFFSILFWWQVGLMGVGIGFFGLGAGFWFGKEFRYATLDEVAMELMQNGSIFVRSEEGGVDPEEIVKIIVEWFRRELQLAPEELRREVVIF